MENTSDNKVHVSFKPNGSLKINGTIVLHYPDGRTEEREYTSICRCGYSKDMPFCDGIHKEIGWVAPTPEPK